VFLVAAFTVFALLLARLAGAPRGSWRYILGAAALTLGASQLLPEGNAFRADVAGSARTLFWFGLAMIPVGIYALWVRRLRTRAGGGADAEPARPRGLVQFPRDAALVAETAAALGAETDAALPGPRLSLGWRDADGALAGHLRLRVHAEVAEIEMLRVVPDRRGRGFGTALLRAAEGEAAAQGATRIGTEVGDWQAPGFLARAGYAAGPEIALGGGRSRRWMEKALS
jgi:ribosomal protein S18 acetylase RimI-like enzyme